MRTFLVVLCALWGLHGKALACSDEYEVIFGVRPASSGIWLSPPKPFSVKFPAVMETSADGVALEAKVRRVSHDHVLIEYALKTRAEGVSAALVELKLSPVDPKPFAAETVDQNGVGWSFSARSLCVGGA